MLWWEVIAAPVSLNAVKGIWPDDLKGYEANRSDAEDSKTIDTDMDISLQSIHILNSALIPTSQASVVDSRIDSIEVESKPKLYED
jgi:hypothetical protein